MHPRTSSCTQFLHVENRSVSFVHGLMFLMNFYLLLIFLTLKNFMMANLWLVDVGRRLQDRRGEDSRG